MPSGPWWCGSQSGTLPPSLRSVSGSPTWWSSAQGRGSMSSSTHTTHGSSRRRASTRSWFTQPARRSPCTWALAIALREPLPPRRCTPARSRCMPREPPPRRLIAPRSKRPNTRCSAARARARDPRLAPGGAPTTSIETSVLMAQARPAAGRPDRAQPAPPRASDPTCASPRRRALSRPASLPARSSRCRRMASSRFCRARPRSARTPEPPRPGASASVGDACARAVQTTSLAHCVGPRFTTCESV
jgi:hypothetical protein